MYRISSLSSSATASTVRECPCPSDSELLDLWDAVPQQQRAVFQDVEATKRKLRAKLSKPEYNVSMYYHDKGIAQNIARSSLFEQVTLSVIILNALWIAVDTDYNPSEVLARAPFFFQLVEQMFCFFFVFEWVIRFMAFERKLNGLRDFWFIFDTLLTLLFVIDSWFMYLYMKTEAGSSGQGLGNASMLRIVRLVRLTRMARMAHILRAVPELSILVKGLGASLRCVSFTLALLFGMLYIFAIVFRLFCSTEEQFCREYFGSVPQSMHTLWIYGTLMDNLETLAYGIESNNPALLILFYIFVILAAITIMNMLIGIVCEIVNNTAEVERETLSINYVKHKLQAIMLRAGMSKVFTGEAKINQEEFLQMIHNRAAASVLGEVGVDAVGLVDFADFIFKDDLMELEDTDEKLLSFADFVEVILKLRGNNTATVKDIIDLRKFVQLKFANIEAKLDAIAGRPKVSRLMRNLSNSFSPIQWGEAPSRRVATVLSTTSSQDLQDMEREKSQEMRRVTDSTDDSGSHSANSASALRKDAAFGCDIRRSRTNGMDEIGTHSVSSLAAFANRKEAGFGCDLQRGSTDATDDIGPLSSSSVQAFATRTDATFVCDFRHLARRFMLEHESALASMHRHSERLQAEFDALTSPNNPVPVAVCKGAEDNSCQPDWLQRASEESSCMLQQADSIIQGDGSDTNGSDTNDKVRHPQFPLTLSSNCSDGVGGSLATAVIVQSDLPPIPTAPSTVSDFSKTELDTKVFRRQAL